MKQLTSSLTDPVTDYANKVIAGEIIAGPHVRASCRRHLADLERDDIYFDLEAVDRVVRFFRNVLTLSEGQFEGLPFELAPSQVFKVGSIFGWKMPNGLRRYRRAYIEEGKGNGKSPLVAGIGLYGLIADGENGAQIYAAAATKDQANILYQDAVSMRERSSGLSKAIDTSGKSPVWNMVHVRSRSFFKPISRETKKTGSGPRPHMALCDEVHEHPDRGIMEMLERGFKFRLQPLLLMITNSGHDKTSVCWEEHQHAVKVAHGEREDDSTFSYVCALDEGDDPLEDPSCWYKANPLLDVILTKEYLAGVVAQAKAIPGKLNNILRLHFCVWTEADRSWLTSGAWSAIQHELCLDDYKGRKCFGGLDLSWTIDLSALALAFPWENGDGLDLFVEFWKPRIGLKDAVSRDSVPYDVWAEQGHLNLTEGRVIKLAPVARRLQEVNELFDLQVIAYDRYRLKDLESNMIDQEGVDVPMVEHPQGFRRGGILKDRDGEVVKDAQGKPLENPLWMPSSIEKFENAIIEEKIRVCVNPCLTWNASSVVVRPDPAGTDNRVFDKRKSTARIDGVVAGAQAIGALHGGPSIIGKQTMKSFWETMTP